jgi:hypothetical protein
VTHEDAPIDQPPSDGTPPNWERRFSLKQLLWLMTILAVVLGIMRWFSPPAAAGLAGLVVLIGLAGMSLSDPPIIVWLAWWALLAIYLGAAAIAVKSG